MDQGSLVFKEDGPFAVTFRRIAAEIAAEDKMIDLLFAGQGTDLPVHGGRIAPQLQHVAQDADVPPGQTAQGADGRAHRVRIGIIAVVDQVDEPGVDPGEPPADGGVGGQAADDLLVREAEQEARSCPFQRREHHVLPE